MLLLWDYQMGGPFYTTSSMTRPSCTSNKTGAQCQPSHSGQVNRIGVLTKLHSNILNENKVGYQTLFTVIINFDRMKIFLSYTGRYIFQFKAYYGMEKVINFLLCST